MEPQGRVRGARLKHVDPDIADAISLEKQRQQENIEAHREREFHQSAVLEAQGSVLTNKCAEGYPRKRW